MTCENLNVKFNEEGSGAIGFSLTGLADEAVTPTTFLWTLTDKSGSVVNSREDVAVTPATTTWILLQGNDLADAIQSAVRKITIKGTYNTTLGGVAKTAVPFTGEYQFTICKLDKIQ